MKENNRILQVLNIANFVDNGWDLLITTMNFIQLTEVIWIESKT